MRTTVITAAIMMVNLTALAAQNPAAPAPSADRMRFGAQVSYASDDVDFGVGAHLDYPMRRLFNNAPIFAQISADVFFPGNDVTYIEANWNANYRFRIQNSPLAPYAGAGLNFAYADTPAGSDSELGLNLVGGIQFPRAGRLMPFVQARLEIEGGELFVLSGGVHF
jgi:hypothetical protein